MGPMFRQNLPAEWINLAEGDRLEPARSFKAKREAADAGEEIKDAEFHNLLPRSVSSRPP